MNKNRRKYGNKYTEKRWCLKYCCFVLVCCCKISLLIFGKFCYLIRIVLAYALAFIMSVECSSQLEGNCWRCREKYTLIARDTNFNRASLFDSMYRSYKRRHCLAAVTFRNNMTISLNKLSDSTYSQCGNYLTNYCSECLIKYQRCLLILVYWCLWFINLTLIFFQLWYVNKPLM